MMVAKDLRKGSEKLLVNGHEVSVMQDGKF